MLIFKHRVKLFGEPNEAVCGVIVKTSRYLVESANRVSCPMCRVIDGIDTPEQAIYNIERDITNLVLIRNKVVTHLDQAAK
jgi:hypothetical protein